MQVAPPASRLGNRVVNKHTLTRPDARHKQISVATMLEKVFLQSLIECVIALVFVRRVLDARIDDRYHLHTLSREFVGERLRIWKAVFVEGEDAVAVHVIDVEMDHV